MHMDFDLYRRIIAELDHPEIIRLNYSGESTHHPNIIEAIELAARTGATVELVTALGSLPDRLVEPLAVAGLSRLTVSLHTLDAEQYGKIYRYSSVGDVRRKLGAMTAVWQSRQVRRPLLDFAIVGMQRNLDQFRSIAEFAEEMGAVGISVHPVIQRDVVDDPFSEELENGKLRPEFVSRLRAVIEEVNDEFPQLPISVSTPELDVTPCLSSVPVNYPGRLPEGARIHSCEQNPWETIHILADGSVVTCEVRDTVILGKISPNSDGPGLADIWNGSAYAQMRQGYRNGEVEECRDCPYKQVYLPSALSPTIETSDGAHAQAFHGWHSPDGSGLLYAKRDAIAELARPAGRCTLHVEGFVPAGVGSVQVFVDDDLIGILGDGGPEEQRIKTSLLVPNAGGTDAQIRFHAENAIVPAETGASNDVRELGFGLNSMKLDGQLSVSAKASKFFARARRRRDLARLQRFLEASTPETPSSISQPWSARWQPGVSILIPERGTPELLERALEGAEIALAAVDEPTEIVVIVNGVERRLYDDLVGRFPKVRWIFVRSALGFSGALARGLNEIRYGGVYLHNSDMVVEPATISTLLPWRASHVFAIASQIFFDDPSKRREETGWGDMRFADHSVELFDREPGAENLVRGALYAGGGSSLFDAEILRRTAAETEAYKPFYWEDADWGVQAWRNGMEVLFHPASIAWHRHRATISRFYSEAEIDRVVDRNANLFQLRNTPDWQSVIKRASGKPVKTVAELSAKTALRGIRVARRAIAPVHDVDLETRSTRYYVRPSQLDKPLVLIVSPYQILPPRHGGARRIWNLCNALQDRWRFILLSDEASGYKPEAWGDSDPFEMIVLVDGRAHGPDDRVSRIRTHSHARLQREIDQLIVAHRPAIVQFENVELAGLQTAKTIPAILTAHDVLFGTGVDPKADAFEYAALAKFDSIVTCSSDDAALLGQLPHKIVPNGAPIRGDWRPSAGNDYLLFAGSLRYAPNLAGISEFIRHPFQALRHRFPGIKLVILGGQGAKSIVSKSPALREAGVHVEEAVDDVHTWLAGCALTINPLYAIRGSSVKLIEALGAGRICVSTREGARGFADAGLPGLIIADEIAAMLEPISEMLDDVDRRVALERPDELALRPFSWQAAAEEQEQLYKQLMSRGRDRQ
jgi:radical SAM protein with 4Fe4S-binding SPASM domain